MSRTNSCVVAAAFVLAGLVSGCASSGDAVLGPPATAATTPATMAPTPTPTPTPTAATLPTVTEAFTLLPCPAHTPQTTLEIEGCDEHAIVRFDRRINHEGQAMYAAMSAPSVKADFVAAQQAWIAYRHAACVSESDADQGGTLAPVAFAGCEVRLDRGRLADLAALNPAAGG